MVNQLGEAWVFDYEDVQLIPKKCIVQSRAECSTSVKLGRYEFELPLVPANMSTVIDENLAKDLARKGFFYVMHRFEPETRLEFVREMKELGLVSSISVGVKGYELEFLDSLVEADLVPDFVTIDIAHGHAESVMNMTKELKQRFGDDCFVIAGNIGTPEAVKDLEEAGADAVKVGIGPGKVCTTKLKTGFGTGGWQLAAINECAKVATVPVIADGGIRTHGDIAKSIAFGADMVMVGSMLAGFEESPGKTVEKDGVVYKEYFGSASANQKTEVKNVEGKHMLMPLKGFLFDELEAIKQDLQSSISYAGGRELMDLRNVEYVIVRNTITNGDRR